MIWEIIIANTAFVTGVGLPLNLLAIWMIFYHTQAEMVIYSQILLQTCIVNIAVIFFNFITQRVRRKFQNLINLLSTLKKEKVDYQHIRYSSLRFIFRTMALPLCGSTGRHIFCQIRGNLSSLC
jgi:hypothetical protein